jgi:hypothetical protein
VASGVEGERGASWSGVFEVRARGLALWKLENLVRDYVAGRVDWDEVHRCAIQMECEKTAEFLPGQDVLEELHSIFLTDAKDDPQFRADRDGISALLSKLDSNRKAPQ